jgi:hypothetical protein
MEKPDYKRESMATIPLLNQIKVILINMMKNKTFDPGLRKGDDEFQKSPLKIIFTISVRKRKKSPTIKDVFYESVNFRWDESDNELF